MVFLELPVSEKLILSKTEREIQKAKALVGGFIYNLNEVGVAVIFINLIQMSLNQNLIAFRGHTL